jgi:hypothetical protein
MLIESERAGQNRRPVGGATAKAWAGLETVGLPNVFDRRITAM